LLHVFVLAFWLVEREVRTQNCLGDLIRRDLLDALFSFSSLHDEFPSWFPVFAIGLRILVYGLSAGPLPWFLVRERFPTVIRPTALAAAVAMATASNWIFAFAFAVIFLFPVTLRN
jgi:hypothetical protein